MTTFNLTIEMDNAAFEGASTELQRLLTETGEQVTMFGSHDGDTGTLRDFNGNTVGTWEVVDEAPPTPPGPREESNEDTEREAEAVDPNACAGGVCTTIDNLCSRHQSQYQRKYGRASNE